uniref:DUF4585 domain-containing protein n=1 Tax=Lates calcarifer TaxID=8187 RepID=A0A4W6CA40_LATCA
LIGGHRKHSDGGYSDTSSGGSFLDETDREVSNLTDRAFRSLCIGDEAVYNDADLGSSSPCIQRDRQLAFSHSGTQGRVSATFQHSFVETSQQEKSLREEQLSFISNGAAELSSQQRRSRSRVSSLIRAFNSEGNRVGAGMDGKLREWNDETSWDKSALMSIQRELSEFSTSYQQNFNSGHFPSAGPFSSPDTGFYSSEVAAVAHMNSTSSFMSASHSKHSMSAQVNCNSNFFIHSEFSPFKVWRDHNRFPFQQGERNNLAPVVPPTPPRSTSTSTVLQKASAVEKRCESELAGHYPHRKRTQSLGANRLPSQRPSTASPTIEMSRRVRDTISSVKALQQKIKMMTEQNMATEMTANQQGVLCSNDNLIPYGNNAVTVEPNVRNNMSTTPFNISQLLTPSVHAHQTEISGVQQYAVSPQPVEHPPVRAESRGATPDVRMSSYKSRATSLLFNLKDNRKRVKNTYSPTKFKGLETMEKNKQPSIQEPRDTVIDIPDFPDPGIQFSQVEESSRMNAASHQYVNQYQSNSFATAHAGQYSEYALSDYQTTQMQEERRATQREEDRRAKEREAIAIKIKERREKQREAERRADEERKAKQIEEDRAAQKEEEMRAKKREEERVKEIKRIKLREEEQRRLKQQEEERAAHEEQQRKAAQEEQQRRDALQEQQRKAAQEEQQRRDALQEQQRKAAQEEQQRRDALQEQQRKAAQEEHQRRAAQEEQKRKAAQEEQKRRAAQEEQQRRAAQEEQRRAAAEEQQRRAAQEEQQRRAAEEQQRRAAEEEKQRRAALEEQQRAALKEKQRRAALEEQQRRALIEDNISEDVESFATSAADLADLRGLYDYERPESACSFSSDVSRSLGKPPAVPPKSEKALRRAKRLTTRRIKKELGKAATDNPAGVEKTLQEVSSILPSSSIEVCSSNSHAVASPHFSSPVSLAHAPSYPLTQRKVLQDLGSGQYFVVDVPVQVKTKTFFDPETGKYVQLNVRESGQSTSRPQPKQTYPQPQLQSQTQVKPQQQPVSQASPAGKHFALYKGYHGYSQGYQPAAINSVPPHRSSAPVTLQQDQQPVRENHSYGYPAPEIRQNSEGHRYSPEKTPYMDTVNDTEKTYNRVYNTHGSYEAFPECDTNSQLAGSSVCENDNSAHSRYRPRDIITMSELEDFMEVSDW